jgi:hypothetical protein
VNRLFYSYFLNIDYKILYFLKDFFSTYSFFIDNDLFFSNLIIIRNNFNLFILIQFRTLISLSKMSSSFFFYYKNFK